MSRTYFVTGTGTGVGKTFVTRGLARALARRGTAVAAVKPLETGCDPEPLDAHAIARAGGRPELAEAPGFFRTASPVAPYAAALGGHAPPPLTELVASIRAATSGAELALVEGAGGLLVPYDRTLDLADLARALDAPLVLVAPDALGTLSHSFAAIEAARARGLRIAALVLTRGAPDDASRASNRRILEERVPDVRLFVFPRCPDDDEALADAAEAAGLLDAIAS